jgi:hypothetical protein
VQVKNENTGGTVGWCLAPVDLAVSKLAASRDKDLQFVSGMIRTGIVSTAAIADALQELDPEEASLVATGMSRCRPV